MSHARLVKSVLTSAWLLFLCVATPAFAQSKVDVLASIKPLALIAQAVVGNRGTVDTLLPVAASPHDFPLRVSDMRRLREADIVLWVGPELETFLQRPLTSVASANQLSAYHLAGLHWPKKVQGQPGATDHGHEDGHHHHDKDPHLWLDPRNGIVIARALAVELARIDPSSGEFYSANAERFAKEIMALDHQLIERLAPIFGRGFAVYHQGYLHFVERYQLMQLGFVTYTPERRPGARHLYQLRKELREKAVCLFTEPYYDQRSAHELAEELGLHVGVLDPMGGEHISSYNQLIEAMAGDFLACLTKT